LLGGGAWLPPETKFSGLIAKRVVMNAYSKPPVSVTRPSMRGVCSLESSDSGGSGSGQTVHHGKSRLVN
ncbi:hypothetical protein, partial [Orrella sp. 11846]|uniref:hypothetical protein n=1 Tax=Orrella sp. 11846 TaxID=3409913 RepID=UPI003B58EDE5